ncbi:MAG: radical SAM family heme chaperone HemW [Bacteroidia bacterium]|nr:radical SAM family heme chaperone HemW [Bacteroidia bacterium]
MSGIYIHIPFCRKACTYCDFHFSTNLRTKADLIAAICTELEFRHNYLTNTHLSSIYFGGGTPSLLSQNELQGLFTTLAKFYTWSAEAEITLEANPDDIDPENLKLWKQLGINRLSIGLQSFNEEELKWMNRAHSAVESTRSVKLAQEAGFNNITIDLIYGSRFQTTESWRQTLQQAIALNTQHISAYNLTIEDKTVLGILNKRGNEPAVNDDLSSQQFLIMKSMLEDAGFVHYEISNFGKPGFFAKHNSNYWLQQPFMGLGPSAHSFNGQSRQWNVKNNAVYVKEVMLHGNFSEKEELSLNDRYNEYVLTRLRTIWGCNVAEMEKLFGEKITTHFKNTITQHLAFIKFENGNYLLNQNGLLQADGIASDLFLV